MRKTVTIFLAILFFSAPAIADQWCQWDGSKGVNCQSDSRGFILINHFPVRTPEVANNKGWYKMTTLQPTLTENQTKDTPVWSFSNNQIQLTWTIRDLDSTEIDQKIAAPMSLNTYYLWKTLLTAGVITQQQAQQYLPQELIDAYQARGRLEINGDTE